MALLACCIKSLVRTAAHMMTSQTSLWGVNNLFCWDNRFDSNRRPAESIIEPSSFDTQADMQDASSEQASLPTGGFEPRRETRHPLSPRSSLLHQVFIFFLLPLTVDKVVLQPESAPELCL